MRIYTNTVAKVLYWTGIVYVTLTFIGGIVLGDIFEIVEFGYYSNDTQFNWTYMFMAWITGFMFSLLFFGAAEVIELLQLQKVETTRLVDALNMNDHAESSTMASRQDVPTYDNLPEL